jgi:hypothetical protein
LDLLDRLPLSRLAQRISIEPEFIVATLHDVSSSEYSLPLNPLVVHPGAVGAAIDQDIALWCCDDFRVSPRHVLVRHHDVTAGIASQQKRPA